MWGNTCEKKVYTNFPNTALPGQEDKVQNIADIWEQTLNALVVKAVCSPLWSPTGLFSERWDLPCYTKPKCKHLSLNFAARSGEREQMLYLVRFITCLSHNQVTCDFIDATAFTMTTKVSLIQTSLAPSSTEIWKTRAASWTSVDLRTTRQKSVIFRTELSGWERYIQRIQNFTM